VIREEAFEVGFVGHRQTLRAQRRVRAVGLVGVTSGSRLWSSWGSLWRRNMHAERERGRGLAAGCWLLAGCWADGGRAGEPIGISHLEGSDGKCPTVC
jgi:hypothetical protein